MLCVCVGAFSCITAGRHDWPRGHDSALPRDDDTGKGAGDERTSPLPATVCSLLPATLCSRSDRARLADHGAEPVRASTPPGPTGAPLTARTRSKAEPVSGRVSFLFALTELVSESRAGRGRGGGERRSELSGELQLAVPALSHPVCPASCS